MAERAELPAPDAQIRVVVALAQRRREHAGEGLAEGILIVVGGPGDQLQQCRGQQGLGIEHGLDGAQFARGRRVARLPADHHAHQFPSAEGHAHAAARCDLPLWLVGAR